MKVLLTSTSFQDVKGNHHELLTSKQWDVVCARGPLSADELKPLLRGVDAVICGDDEFNAEVLNYGYNLGLRYISKYGVGLDKIDVNIARRLGIKVRNCIGVNENAVAEHAISLLLAHEKRLFDYYIDTKCGKWNRMIGRETYNKSVGILGLGAIGKRFAKICLALEMNVFVFDKFLDDTFTVNHDVIPMKSVIEMFKKCDYVSVHLPLNDETKGMLTHQVFKEAANPNMVLINTSRSEIIGEANIRRVIEDNLIRGYLTDVLDQEPLTNDNNIYSFDEVWITPHVGSRTVETVERQGSMAVANLEEMIFLDREA